MKKIVITGILGVMCFLSGCINNSSDSGIQEESKIVEVVTTTGLIADTVSRVGGKNVSIKALVGPGVDPHLFKPTLGHVKAMQNADIIFYNGIELEARMGDALVSMARNGKKTFPVTENIDVSKFREPEEFEGKYDPHFWHDIPLWIESVRKVEKELSIIDPKNASIYRENANKYREELEALDKKVFLEIQKIPVKNRVLITAHDAFGYFGERYGVEVRGVVGISTADEASARGIDELADFVVKRGVKSVFIESIDSGEGIRALQLAVQAKGGTVKIGEKLLADSLASPGEEGDTYISMVEHNLKTLVKGLQ